LFGEIKIVFLCNYLSLGSSPEKSEAIFSSLRFATINTNHNTIAKGAETSRYPINPYHMLDLSFENSVGPKKSGRPLQDTCHYDNQQTSECN
jgi:hypothetical protein